MQPTMRPYVFAYSQPFLSVQLLVFALAGLLELVEAGGLGPVVEAADRGADIRRRDAFLDGGPAIRAGCERRVAEAQ